MADLVIELMGESGWPNIGALPDDDPGFVVHELARATVVDAPLGLVRFAFRFLQSNLEADVLDGSGYSVEQVERVVKMLEKEE